MVSAHQALRSLGELKRVVSALGAAGVNLCVLKGLPLAQMLYGNLGLRSPGDIDLLIHPGDIRQSDRILRGLGYVPILPIDCFSPRQFAFYRAHWKDMAYENPENGFALDLHWRCFRNPVTPGSSLCSAASATVHFGSFRVETLSPDESLLYLCVHGTLDGWIYLKSLADVAAALRIRSSAELDRLADLAAKHHILPEFTATLLLVRRYLGLASWSSRLLPKEDRTVAHILKYTEVSLEQRDFLAAREQIPIATTLAFEFGLRRGLRYRWEIALRILYRARMWKMIRLPDFLFWSYPFLSPFEWLIFRIRSRCSNCLKPAEH